MSKKEDLKVEINTPFGPLSINRGFFASMVVALRSASPTDSDAKIGKKVAARAPLIRSVRSVLNHRSEVKRAVWLGVDATDEIDYQ